MQNKKALKIVTVGHVDHGKSSVIGRLLVENNSLPVDKLQLVRDFCRKSGQKFEYAYLLDALKDEQAQGITIDTARIFFHSKNRKFQVLDTPGHIQFLKNMVTGAANADIAILVVDANAGIEENTTRHAYLLSFLGIKNIIVVVNKMDIVDFSQDRYNEVCQKLTRFLEKIKFKPRAFVPTSASTGDNMTSSSEMLNWYHGLPLMAELESIPLPIQSEKADFRLWLQDIYKFLGEKRYFVGTIASGSIQAGDQIQLSPSNQKATVKTIEKFPDGEVENAKINEAVALTIEPQLYLQRGEIVSKSSQSKPLISQLFSASIFWLARSPCQINKTYKIKTGTKTIEAQIVKIDEVMDASSLHLKNTNHNIAANEVAKCTILTKKPIAHESVRTLPLEARFVLIDNTDIAGGGLFLHGSRNDSKVGFESSFKTTSDHYGPSQLPWLSPLYNSHIDFKKRALRNKHKPGVIIIKRDSILSANEKAYELEKALFDLGVLVTTVPVNDVMNEVALELTCRHLLNVGAVIIFDCVANSLKNLAPIGSLVERFAADCFVETCLQNGTISAYFPKPIARPMSLECAPIIYGYLSELSDSSITERSKDLFNS